MALFSFLDRDHTIAPPGFDRWRVPPAALAIHLSIGQAYAFSVFNLPLSRLRGITAPASDDWRLTTIGWIFSVAIVCLGLSAFTFGRWLEQAGPRKAMFASASCFGGGFVVAALGVQLHQFWLVVLGYGVIGGIGLGLGYISPVSTLIRWFPDRPGMATGLAIMGFGGGAMIGSPLGVALMEHYRSATSLGVVETFVVMGAAYFVFMLFGVFTVRLPAPGWVPHEGRAATRRARVAAGGDVHVDRAIRTPQFWLLWTVLLLNVTAGIGVLGQASPMIQEMFPGTITAGAAAGFVGLLSLANMIGRFGWSSLSDVIGRRRTYMVYFALGALLYAGVPSTGRAGQVVLFVACYAVIMSMYGGGFATIPAYLRDAFGTMHVGAIHGRLLTAWSLAGVAGPVLVNYLREYQVARGVPARDAYSVTMYLMALLLVVGFAANWFVRPVGPEHFFVRDDGRDAVGLGARGSVA
ncbi:MAG: OFA family MFS transporter [Gemmatimonadetes bacterium]|nr:OFA family MFS transporter [Gemmatimonadota bacterium]